MSTLKTAQLATLKAAIQADSTANAALVAGDTVTLLAWCNGAKTPAALAWRVAVPPDDSDEAPSYSAFDTIAAGKRDSWGFFLQRSRNFSKNKVRSWVTDVWGAATAASNAESILQAGTEPLTNAQSALGGSTKTTGTVAALDRTYASQVDQEDVNALVATG